jgi:hypothetical protein
VVTRTNRQIVVNAAGLVPVCAWCVSPAERAALRKLHPVTDGLCPACKAALEAESHALQVEHPSGHVQTLKFSSACARGLAAIALAAQPVTLKILGVLLALVAIATPASAEPKFSGAGLTSYVLAVAGQSADLATTARNYQLGLTESNPIYGAHPSIGKIALVKAGETVAIVGLMKLFEHVGCPKAAKALGYMGGIGGIIPAVINTHNAARVR